MFAYAKERQLCCSYMHEINSSNHIVKIFIPVKDIIFDFKLQQKY